MIEQIEKLKQVLDIELPSSFYSNIIPVFKDNDNTNWLLSNVSYVFKEPQECPFYPSYFYIPGFSRYVINKDGEILVVRTAAKKKWYITKSIPNKNITGGYFVGEAIPDTGKRTNLSRHRALCLAFKPIIKHPHDLHVNHKNGIPGDDVLDNLEWCTPAQNVKHAYDNGLFPNKVTPVDAWNWITDEKRSFPSIQKCCEYLGFLHTKVQHRLSYSNSKKYIDGWRFKRIEEEWLPINRYVGESDQHRDIVCRDVFNNSVFIYNTLREAATLTNNIVGSIYSQCVNKVVTPMNGWNFRFLDEFEGWPVYTERHLQIFKNKPLNPSNGIIVFDLEKNEEMFFSSSEECGKYFNISPITANKLARYEGTRGGRYKFNLFKVKDITYSQVPLLSNQ